MSRIGKQIITIPQGVQVSENNNLVQVKGAKGTLEQKMPQFLTLQIEGDQLQIKLDDENDNRKRVYWGTHTSLIKNMVEGVTSGFSKELEINGVGFKVAQSGKKLTFNLGYSHPIDFELPLGIEAAVEKNKITISGINKQQVGQVAAEIRKLRLPEPYKGKGIKYSDEVIRRKAGKAAAGGES